MPFYTWCELKSRYAVYATLPNTIEFFEATVVLEDFSTKGMWVRKFRVENTNDWSFDCIKVPYANFGFIIRESHLAFKELTAELILDFINFYHNAGRISEIFKSVDGFPACLAEIKFETMVVPALHEHAYLKKLESLYNDNNGWDLIILKSGDVNDLKGAYQGTMGAFNGCLPTLFLASPLLANPAVIAALSRKITPRSRFYSDFVLVDWERASASFIEVLWGPTFSSYEGTILDARKLCDSFVDQLRDHFGNAQVFVSYGTWIPSGSFGLSILILSESTSQVCLFYAWDDY